jgi:hypothetical protein
VRAPFSWWWAAAAIALTVASIATGAQEAVALPLAAAAAACAVVALLETIHRQPSGTPSAAVAGAREPSRVRGWLDAGRLGREELVLLVDRLERKALTPTLPIRSPTELAKLVRLPPAEFRRYLENRLARIEAVS